MPTVRLEWYPYRHKLADIFVGDLYPRLPEIIAPHMNIEGRELHDGGVSEDEIIVNVIKCGDHDLNVNDIQVTIIAHKFDERLEKLDGMTEAIRDEIREILHGKSERFYRDLKIAVSVWLVDMGYATV